MDWQLLFGHKTVAFFDLWSIEHIVSGISFGSLAFLHTRKKFSNVVAQFGATLEHLAEKQRAVLTRFDVITVLFIAYFWETLEHYLETGLLGPKVVYWFQGVEAWDNRFISDPLMLLLGYWIVKRWPKLVWPARIFSIVWLYFHIFVFPHSMYLQDMLDRILYH